MKCGYAITNSTKTFSKEVTIYQPIKHPSAHPSEQPIYPCYQQINPFIPLYQRWIPQSEYAPAWIRSYVGDI